MPEPRITWFEMLWDFFIMVFLIGMIAGRENHIEDLWQSSVTLVVAILAVQHLIKKYFTNTGHDNRQNEEP